MLLYEKFLANPSADVGQAEITALMPVGELRVIEAQAIENRGLKVVDVNFVLCDVEADVVGLSYGLASFDSSARKPHAESERMMVAAFVARLTGSANLDHWRASDWPAPDHSRIVEQPAL